MIMEKVYTESQEKVINVSRGYNMVLAGPGCARQIFWQKELLELMRATT